MRVVLRSPRNDTILTDDHGRFRFASIGTGRLILSVGRIGYRRRTDTLSALSPGEALLLPMSGVPLDGPCSGFTAVRVHKPWWKF